LAAQLHARTGEERWAAFWSAGAERLLGEWRRDDTLEAWLWTQRLGTQEARYLGEAHGLVGNLHVLRRGGALLPAEQRDDVERRGGEAPSRAGDVVDGRAQGAARGEGAPGGNARVRVLAGPGAP